MSSINGLSLFEQLYAANLETNTAQNPRSILETAHKTFGASHLSKTRNGISLFEKPCTANLEANTTQSRESILEIAHNTFGASDLSKKRNACIY